ncbi:nucleotidyltransferase family protein [Lacrimispora sp.]|uniref:nucleotidyltransferase domain-containing protein n=1 Tax=Lacrimispora sp. TaxID=2719234 RepID=UPI0034617337
MSKGYEERYLMTLLSSVMNQKEAPAPLRYLNWEKLFRIADYHRVAHIVHYGIMGLDEEIPQPVRQRFFDKYLESVHRIERLRSTEKQIETIFEKREIDCFFLSYSDIVKYYPVEEMCCREFVEIGLKKKDVQTVRAFFRGTDFEELHTEAYGELYYKIPGSRVSCFNHTMFFSKSMQKFYINLFHSLRNKEKFQHIREMNPTEMYLFFICRLTDSYAKGDISLNQIIDFWVFYKTYGEVFEWSYIYERLKKLKIADFAEHLEYLILRWLGTGAGIENVEMYDAMESYIFSKGAEGREISAQFLPLITKVADCYARDRKAEELRRLIIWMFPDRMYMETIYPRLEKSGMLLPLFWIFRLGRYGIRVAANRVEKEFLAFKKRIFHLMKRQNQRVEEEVTVHEDGNTEELNHEEETADVPK